MRGSKQTVLLHLDSVKTWLPWARLVSDLVV